MGIYRGLIFDLDGVLVDTAKYHFLAWSQIAESLGIVFTESDNERLKGVSRMRSLEILLEIGGFCLSELKKDELCAVKNEIYLSYIEQLRSSEILSGAKEFLLDVRAKGYKIALGSASKNSTLILEKLRIANLFDVIIDGSVVELAKPDPEVFLKGAETLGMRTEECIVFEDAEAGIHAAQAAGMKVVGVGNSDTLSEADIVIPGFAGVTIEYVVSFLGE